MAFQRAGSLEGLPPGSVMEAEINGKVIAVCNYNGQIHALDGICPHEGGPLGNGALHDQWLVCPLHAWEFDCTTGVNDFDAETKQQKFAVRIEGDDILVDIG